MADAVLMPRPGFGTQPFGISRFGEGARDITVRWGRLAARTVTAGPLRARTLTGRVVE